MRHQTSILMSLLAPVLLLTSCVHAPANADPFEDITISENNRFFAEESGQPFFWLGDTAWLLFTKLDRQEAVDYLTDREAKGFTVIQSMVLHSLETKNLQGDAALFEDNISRPLTTPGNNPDNAIQYDYWDHVEYVVDQAAARGLWMALVPVWGSPVKGGHVSAEQMRVYAGFLAARFGDKPNIIWLNGGDTFGDQHTEVWQILGNTLHARAPNQLMTFHPRGRHRSSEWFHSEPWLDFNMFQSGHRHYHQDTAEDSFRFGPDNWRYAQHDYALTPTKPTLDGEPSYEGIPQGLHDTTQPYWEAKDARRYAYWSVFAGAAGHTYGHNCVMQFYRESDGDDKAYGAKTYWRPALDAPGARQMAYLKKLMLSRKNYFDRVPDPTLVMNQGEKFNYLAATRGPGYALIYSYTGRNIQVNLKSFSDAPVSARWYDPRTGNDHPAESPPREDVMEFDPPGSPKEGNDWVLILEAQ